MPHLGPRTDKAVDAFAQLIAEAGLSKCLAEPIRALADQVGRQKFIDSVMEIGEAWFWDNEQMMVADKIAWWQIEKMLYKQLNTLLTEDRQERV